mmetsp:Transcript_49823/g.139456  ORF Transcript_49823/g.139456 Transcript_49823/m.139456 type:complete len:500 (-) Transcript_49823:73-1572(-)
MPLDAKSRVDDIVFQFRILDESGTGTISRNELLAVLRKAGGDSWTESKLDVVLKASKIDLEAPIDYMDFVAWLFKGVAGKPVEEAEARATMSVIVRCIDVELNTSDSHPGGTSPCAIISWISADGSSCELVRSRTHSTAHSTPQWDCASQGHPHSAGARVEFQVYEDDFVSEKFRGKVSDSIESLAGEEYADAISNATSLVGPIRTLNVEQNGTTTGVVTVQVSLVDGADDDVPPSDGDGYSKFQSIDQNSDGHIDRKELGDLLRTLDESWCDQRLDSLFGVIDVKGDGVIDYDEFMTWLFGAHCVKIPGSTGRSAVKGMAPTQGQAASERPEEQAFVDAEAVEQDLAKREPEPVETEAEAPADEPRIGPLTLTVISMTGDVATVVECSPEDSLRALVRSISVDVGVSAEFVQLAWDGRVLESSEMGCSLARLGFQSGDEVLFIQRYRCGPCGGRGCVFCKWGGALSIEEMLRRLRRTSGTREISDEQFLQSSQEKYGW